MTTANGSPASPRRRRAAAFPRAISPRSARTPRARQPARRPWRSLRGSLLHLIRRGIAAASLAGAIAILPGTAGAQALGDAEPQVFGRSITAEPLPRSEAPRSWMQVAAWTRPVATQPATPAAASAETSPRSACLAAARRAEAAHNLPDGLLVAIALNESGLHAHALSIRGRAHFPATRAEAERLYRAAGGSLMAGCVQVNARVHARGETWPLDPDRATDWAGRFLRDAHARSGSWAEAVRIWHGGRPGTTQRLVCRIRAKLDVTAPHSGLFNDRNCGNGNVYAARLRRNGEVHLQVAEAGDR